MVRRKCHFEEEYSGPVKIQTNENMTFQAAYSNISQLHQAIEDVQMCCKILDEYALKCCMLCPA